MLWDNVPFQMEKPWSCFEQSITIPKMLGHRSHREHVAVDWSAWLGPSDSFQVKKQWGGRSAAITHEVISHLPVRFENVWYNDLFLIVTPTATFEFLRLKQNKYAFKNGSWQAFVYQPPDEPTLVPLSNTHPFRIVYWIFIVSYVTTQILHRIVWHSNCLLYSLMNSSLTGVIKHVIVPDIIQI